MLKIISDRAVKLKTVEKEEEEENSRWNPVVVPFLLYSDRMIFLLFLSIWKFLERDRADLLDQRQRSPARSFAYSSSSSSSAVYFPSRLFLGDDKTHRPSIETLQ